MATRAAGTRGAPAGRDGTAEAESRCGTAVLLWLKNSERDDAAVKFDRLVRDFGVEPLRTFFDRGNKHKNWIIHSLAQRGNAGLIRHLVEVHGFDVNAQRAGDQNTALHLACFSRNLPLEQELRALGADAMLRNSYLETADETKSTEKPPRALICGASTWQDVLQVVQAHGARFDDLDYITAYEWIGKKVASFEGERRWAPSRTSLEEVRRDPHFVALATSCEALARRWPPAERATNVTALLNALLKLPNDGIAGALLQAALSQQSPFEGWPAEALATWASLIGKLGSDLELRRRCLRLAAEPLMRAVPTFEKYGLSKVLWALATMQEPHAGLLSALCEHLESHVGNDGFRNGTLLSISAWALAKLGPSGAWPWQRALASLSVAIAADVTSFEDQNVANTLWAHARLRSEDDVLFRECFRRASVTLYEPCPQKVAHWAQDYYAYQYCVVAVPAALDGLSPRLASDMVVTSRLRMAGSTERLSQASGIASARDLRELDEMIARLEGGEDVGGTDFAEEGGARERHQRGR